jgi:hypothetical protein
MTARVPQTIANELLNQLHQLMGDGGFFKDPADFTLRRIRAEIGKLAGVSPFEAHLAYATYYQVCGDAGLMRHHLDNAMKLGDRQVVLQHAAASESNLGFFSSALRAFREAAKPEFGAFSLCTRLPIPCAAFQLTVEYLDQAEKMKMSVQPPKDIDVIQTASAVLAEAGVSDSDVAEMMDMAGEVFREENMIWVGDIDVVILPPRSADPDTVLLIFTLPVTANRTAELFDRYADKVARRTGQIPDALQIAFAPSR